MPESRSPRDAQRRRVYLAESPMPSSPLPGLDACENYAARVVGTLWWQQRFPEHTLDKLPRFRPGNGARQAFYREDPGHPTITLPRRYRTKAVVLHELVHWAMCNERDLPSHGRTFARIMLDATEEHLGRDRALQLKLSFMDQKVHVGKPAKLGPDGILRYGLDERLRLGKEKRFIFSLSDSRQTTLTGVFERYERGSTFLRVRFDEGVDILWMKGVYDIRPAPVLRLVS